MGLNFSRTKIAGLVNLNNPPASFAGNAPPFDCRLKCLNCPANECWMGSIDECSRHFRSLTNSGTEHAPPVKTGDETIVAYLQHSPIHSSAKPTTATDIAANTFDVKEDLDEYKVACNLDRKPASLPPPSRFSSREQKSSFDLEAYEYYARCQSIAAIDIMVSQKCCYAIYEKKFYWKPSNMLNAEIVQQ